MRTPRLLRRLAAVAVAIASVVALLVAMVAHDSGRRRDALARPGGGPAFGDGAGGGSGSGGGSPNRPGSVIRPVRVGRGPNVVFVLTDDLSTDLIRYMPHVQALAAAGISFSNYFVVDSLCCPSRASILTGNYPHNTGVFYNTGPQGGYHAFMQLGNNRKTFGLALQSAGYRTGFMGKFLNHYPPTDPPPAGWDDWDVTGTEGYAEFDYHLNENGHVHHYGTRPADYLTDVLRNKAIGFIDRAAASRRPFALEVATYAPHNPAPPAPVDQGTFPYVRAPRGVEWGRLPRHAPRWLAHYPQLKPAQVRRIDNLYRRRVESVQAVDRMVGQLQAELARRGLLGDTYFVFSSDNGFHMGQRRMLPGKQTAYDTDVRVPLIVTGPGVPIGRVDDTLVSSLDLAPTFEQIAGKRSRFVQDGTSMLGLWHGRPAPPTWVRAVLVEHRSSVLGGDPDVQPGHSGLAPDYEALRTPRFLYVEYISGDREYYDLRSDPHELNNIAGELSPLRLTQLHQMLVSMETCRGQQCRSRTLAIH